VLEDQLLLIVGFEHNRIFIERTDAPRQLDAAQEVNGDIQFFLAGGVEEGILNVLRRLAFHADLLSFLNRESFLNCTLSAPHAAASTALRNRGESSGFAGVHPLRLRTQSNTPYDTASPPTFQASGSSCPFDVCAAGACNFASPPTFPVNTLNRFTLFVVMAHPEIG
jgi:hypothetical protein